MDRCKIIEREATPGAQDRANTPTHARHIHVIVTVDTKKTKNNQIHNEKSDSSGTSNSPAPHIVMHLDCIFENICGYQNSS